MLNYLKFLQIFIDFISISFMAFREIMIDDVKCLVFESEAHEPPKVELGNLEDLCYKPRGDVAAIFVCITDTKGEEIIWEGKPFMGYYIDDIEPISYEVFDKANEFIDKHIKNGCVKVVCEEGKSRSVAISLAYYMHKGMSLDEAVKELERYPSCRIHGWSLINWAHEKGYMDRDIFEKEKLKIR